jgi:LuxR family maltose regulon positive regulatory protein
MAAARAVACLDGLDALLVDAEMVREAGGPPGNPWWVVATLVEGTAHSMLGNTDQARDLLRAALAQSWELPAFEGVALAHLALLALDAGDPVEADRLAARARRIADDHHLEGMVPTVALFVISALVSAVHGRAEEADRIAATARVLLSRLGDLSARTALFCYVMLARTERALQRPVEARTWLEEAERARRRDDSATHVVAQLEELQIAVPEGIDLRDVQVQPLTAAELRVLAYLPTHLSLKEIADRLIISRNTVKTHCVAVYRKLGVSSRSEAVEAAGRLGFLAVAERP